MCCVVDVDRSFFYVNFQCLKNGFIYLRVGADTRVRNSICPKVLKRCKVAFLFISQIIIGVF